MSALISNPAVRSLLRGLLVWAPLWIFTTIAFGALGVIYVFFIKQDAYLASQALLVRDEATGAVMRLGRFQSQAEMKAAQETLLEMSKSHQVVRDALLVVGKPSGLSSWFDWGDYPSKEQIESVAKYDVSVHAPKGTEFGVTEVIYLDVKADSPEIALELNKALCDSLESRMQQVRRARADGVVMELVHARDSAKRELNASTVRLREMETNAGSDLTDLRGMTDTIAGGATSRNLFDQIRNEIRQAELARQSLLADKELLMKAADDPNSLMVAPGALLSSQPGLKRLREGLVDAQINGSQLSGRFTENHPLVNASQTAQSTIAKRLLQELKASVASVDSEIELVNAKIQRLTEEQNSFEDRLTNLADSRSTYSNMLAEVKSKITILESTEKELAEAQAARDSSVSTSLLTRLDAPMVSDRPVGPGRTTIAGMCTLAGLIFGLGIVFIITPIDAGPLFGRRSADRYRTRRDASPLADSVETRTNSTNSVSPHSNDIVMPTNLPLAEINPGQSLTEQNSHSKIASNGTRSKEAESKPAATASNSPEASNNDVDEVDFSDVYQPLIKPRPAKVVAELKTDPPVDKVKSENREVDLAFQELYRLQAQRPENRSEELSLQMKVQELKLFLSTQGADVKALHPQNNSPKISEHLRIKPRPTGSLKT
jgi:uncharacterized protein involved in exopolysaccharide biosynthesis